MRIIDKIEDIHQRIEGDPDGNAVFGNKLRTLARLAVEQGISSRAWEQYMRIFASNGDQLKRLIGEDEAFNQTPWGRTALVYLVGNGTCGIDTKANTGREMSEEIKNVLDAGDLNAADEPF